MMRKILIFILVFVLAAVIHDIRAEQRDILSAGPEIRLIYPTTEAIFLEKGKNLEFRWNAYGGGYLRIDSYEFKLYKGYNTTLSGLILKKILPANTYYLEINSEALEDNQVYTWGIRGIFRDGRKSDFAFTSFKIKKNTT